MPRSRIFWLSAGAAAVAFAILAALVAGGQLGGIDGHAVKHWMPYDLDPKEIRIIGPLFSYHGYDFDPLQVIRAPASAIPSAVLVLIACLALVRRGRWSTAFVWAGAFVAASIVAELCKHLITRSPVSAVRDGELVLVSGFDSSFPSGHALRAALAAAALAAAWPRLKWLLVAWVVAVSFVLDLYGVHVPSDIVGGLLLASAFIFAALALLERLPARALSPRQQLPGLTRGP
jgi:undecaprenyl-diphosphatase